MIFYSILFFTGFFDHLTLTYLLTTAMVNLEVMFLTRTECSLNNSKAKSSRNFVVDPDGNTHCCRSTIFEYFRINYKNDKDDDSKEKKN